MSRRAVRMLSSSVTLLAVLASLMVGLPPDSASAQKPLKILVVGDSQTQGSTMDYTWRYFYDRHLNGLGVPHDMVGDYRSVYDIHADRQTGDLRYRDTGFDQDHSAWWGRGIGDAAMFEAPVVARHQPDVMLVQLGVNDLAWDRDPEAMARGMRSLVTAVRREKSNLKMAFGLVVPTGMQRDDPSFAAVVAGANRVIARTVNELRTPASPVVVADARSGYSVEQDTWDSTHPDSSGQVRLAAAFARASSALGVGRPMSPLPRVPHGGPVQRPQIAITSMRKSVRVRWTQVPGGTTTWVEVRDVTAGAPWGRIPFGFGLATRQYDVTGLRAGARVDIRVVAAKGSEQGPVSTVASSHPSAPRPPAPTIWLTRGNASAAVSWRQVPGATTARIWRRPAGTTQRWTLVTSRARASAGSFVSRGLRNGQQYQYRVEMMTDLVVGASSPVRAVTPLASARRLNAPVHTMSVPTPTPVVGSSPTAGLLPEREQRPRG